MRPLSLYVAIFLSTLLLAGCGQQEREKSLNPQALPSAPSITLDEVAVVESFGDHYFSGLRMPALAANGDLIQSAYNAQMLFRISADGELLQTIGRDGRGPGEFQSINSMVMAPGDTLHVFDYNNARQQLFAPDGTQWSPARELERRRPSVGTPGLNYFAPSAVFEVNNEPMGLFRNRIMPADTANMYHSWLARLDHNLNPVDDEKILLKPSENAMVISIPGGMLVNSHPFSYQLFRAWNPAAKLLAEISNADAELRLYRPDGEQVRAIQLPYEKAPPDETAREEYEQQMADNHGNDIAREARQKALPHQPLISDFLIDDEGRYWLQMSRLENSSPNWMVFDADGGLLGSLLFTQNWDEGTHTRPLAVHNNRLYALHYDEYEPSLRIYDVLFDD
jgi:hypothetical protein